MLPSWFTSRMLFLGVFAVCTAMMACGYWLQFALGLEPCPLCMTQRVFIVAVGLAGLVATMHDPARLGTRIYAAVMALGRAPAGGAGAWPGAVCGAARHSGIWRPAGAIGLDPASAAHQV